MMTTNQRMNFLHQNISTDKNLEKGTKNWSFGLPGSPEEIENCPCFKVVFRGRKKPLSEVDDGVSTI